MKNVLLLIFFLTSFSGHAAPLYGTELNDFQKAYLDSENILVNPGFESGLTGWTTTGTATSEPTVVFKGKKSLKVVLSNQVLNITQNSTLYAAQFADGAQGLLTVRIKNTAPDVRFCPTQAGVIVSALCINVSTNGKWGHYKRPVTLGGTSNGFTIDSNGVAVSGTTIVDDSKLGAQDVKQDVDQSRIAGSAYFAGTAGCAWARTSTTLGGFTADADCPGPTVSYSSMGTWATTDSNLPRQTITNLPAGTYKATFTFMNYNSVAGQGATFSITDGTTTCPSNSGDESTNGGFTSVTCVFNYSSSGDRVFELSTHSASGSVIIDNSVGTGFNRQTKFILEYFGSGSTYSSNNADTSIASWTPVITTASGAMTNYSATGRWHRDGQHLIGEVSIAFSAASGTWATPIIALPNGLLVDTSKMVDPAEARLGQGTALDNLVNRYGLRVSIFGTSVAINSGFVTSSATAGTPISDNSTITSTFPFAFNTGDRLTVNFKVPVVGWENSNGIIGSFIGMVTSQGSTSPDIQSVYFGSGNKCSAPCTTGNCTICNLVGTKITSVSWVGTAVYRINGIDGDKYNCSGTASDTAQKPVIHSKLNSTSSYAQVYTNGTNASEASVTCTGNP